MTTYSALYEFNNTGLDAFEKIFTGKLDESAIDPTDDAVASRVRGTGAFMPAKFDTSKEMARLFYRLSEAPTFLNCCPRRAFGRGSHS